MATNVSGHISSRLFFILKRTEVSAIPADRKVGQAGLSLQAANGTQIPTFGTPHSLSTLDFAALTAGCLLLLTSGILFWVWINTTVYWLTFVIKLSLIVILLYKLI